jgi:hypothetical protein
MRLTPTQAAALKQSGIFVASGWQDPVHAAGYLGMDTGTVQEVADLANAGVPVTPDFINGGHEWYVWRILLRDFLTRSPFPARDGMSERPRVDPKRHWTTWPPIISAHSGQSTGEGVRRCTRDNSSRPSRRSRWPRPPSPVPATAKARYVSWRRPATRPDFSPARGWSGRVLARSV